jgi:hypothetical protein
MVAQAGDPCRVLPGSQVLDAQAIDAKALAATKLEAAAGVAGAGVEDFLWVWIGAALLAGGITYIVLCD